MKIKLIAGVLLLAALSQCVFAHEVFEFKNELPISASASAPETAVDDARLLVRLSTAISGFKYSDFADGGSDMIFGVVDGNTIVEYPHEIETWNPDGESTVWVKVPSWSQGSEFSMWFGNGVSVESKATNVWSGYRGVWHMDEASGNCEDSTGNGLTAVPSGASSADSVVTNAAPTGAGRQFGTAKANKTYLAVSDDGLLDLGDTFTISGWFKAKECFGNYSMRYFSRKSAYNAGDGFESEARYSSDIAVVKTTVSSRGAASGDYTQTVPDITENWVNVVWCYQGTTLKYYVNGEEGSMRTLNKAAANNNLAFTMGNNPKGTESNWVGWMDEFRMSTGTVSAAQIAIDYATVNDASYLTYSAVVPIDVTMPKLDVMAATVNDGGSVTITAEFSENMPADGSVKAIVDGVEYAMGTLSTTVPATYSVAIGSLAENTVYDYSVGFGSTGGNSTTRYSAVPFYTGEVDAAKISDADETLMTPGVIRFSIPVALTQDLTFAYAIGGTAVAEESYETLSGSATITNGSTSIDVNVVPIYSAAVNSNVTVRLTVSDGSVIGGESAELTIVNSEANPYLRYVSTTGNDDNSGTSLGSAKATLAAAIASLDSVSADHDCTINVAEGTYELALSPAGATEWSVVLTNRISVIGMTGDPKDVTFVRGSTAYGLFRVNNENANLRYLTISGGLCDGSNDAKKGIQKGAGVYLQGGVVEDCVVTGSRGPAYGQSGIGVYVDGGRVSRCRITAGTSSNGSQNGTGIYVASGLVEDSLVDANTCGDAGSVYVKGGATFLNCTVVNNTGALTSGVRVEKATAKVVNCAIFDNTASESAHGGVYTWDYGAAYHNCASDYEIIGGDNCIVCQPRFRDAANKDYMPSAGSKLIDAGASRSTYSAVSMTDLAGSQRETGTVDIGCYENTKAVAEVALEWSADSQVIPATLTLNAASYGIDSPVYSWTLHNNDTGVDIEKSGATVSVGDLTAGTYTVSVAAGSCSYTSPYTYTLSPKDIYVVSSNVNAEFPYDTEAKASATIATALAAAGDAATIHVKNGTYPITTQIKLDKAVRIVGESRNGVIVTNTTKTVSSRIFYMNNANAEVSTMTLAGGYSFNAGNGGNLYFSGTGGMVSNCLVTAGLVVAQYNQGSGAAYMNGGVLTHCEITGCNANPSKSIECNRVVSMNKKSIAASRVSNCLIHDCDCSNGGSANKGGALINVGDYCLLDSCTIVDCVAFTNSAIVYIKASNNSYPKSGHIVNSAIFGQDAAGSKARCAYGESYNNAKWPQLYYNCVTEESLTDGTYEGHDCITSTPAECFADYAGKDFSAKAGGTLVDAGAASEYAQLFPSVDYLGKTRVYKTVIDIGCCEYQPSAGLIIFLR